MTAKLTFVPFLHNEHTHIIALSSSGGNINLTTSPVIPNVQQTPSGSLVSSLTSWNSANSVVHLSKESFIIRLVERWVERNCVRDVLYHDGTLFFLDGWFAKEDFDQWWFAKDFVVGSTMVPTDFICHLPSAELRTELRDWLKTSVERFVITTSTDGMKVFVELNNDVDATLFKLRWSDIIT